jgi:hypothetical protein
MAAELSAALAVAATLLAAPSVRAADEKPFRLDYQAAAGCPSREDLIAKLRSRSRRLVESRAAETEVSIALTRAGERFAGRSRVALPDGVRVRSLDGATCEEVADALALIVALNLDPDAGSDDSAPDQQPNEPNPTPPAPEPAPPSTAHVWSAVLGAGLTLRSGVVPNAEPGFYAFAEADSEGEGVAPSLRLAVARVTGEKRGAAGTGDFAWTAVSLEGCPLGTPARGAWRLRPCAAFEVGGLHAEGRGLTLPKSPTRLWLAPALVARGTWQPTPLLRLEATLGASFPLSRPSFVFDSGERLFDVPAAGFRGAVALGVVLH